MAILLTGGAGYIGSHSAIEFLSAGHDVIVVDNLSNSSRIALERVEQITGKSVAFYETDIRDRDALRAIFSDNAIEAVVHFAGLKAVGESVARPLFYYDNNVGGSNILCEVMAEFGVKSIVFSSSATVYGAPDTVPIPETAALRPTNPYGWSKFMIEQILRDLHLSDQEWRVAILRYFNPAGAHESGLIGEDPNDIPNNLMPYISQVAIGKLEMLSVFGGDYETRDGTGVRDYLHVVDLARGHVDALKALDHRPGILTVNLGTGQGYSVLEVANAFKQASGKPIPYKITGRRAGDIAECYADAGEAERMMGWKAQFGLDRMCADSWRWQTKNPNGYRA